MTFTFIYHYIFLPAYLHYLLEGFVVVSATSIIPTVKMSSPIPNINGRPLKILSIFHWNMSPADAILNSTLVSLYLPN